MNYRKAKPGEIQCSKCAWSGIRTISNRLECRYEKDGRWGVTAKGGTCDRAKALCDTVKIYPIPNENGIYFSDQADEVLRFTIPTRREFIIITVMEAASGEWLAAYWYRFNEGGGGYGLSRRWGVYTSKQEALTTRTVELTKRLKEETQRCDGPKREACINLLQQIEMHQNQGNLF